MELFISNLINFLYQIQRKRYLFKCFTKKRF